MIIMESLQQCQFARQDHQPCVERRLYGLRQHDAALAAPGRGKSAFGLPWILDHLNVQPKRRHVPAVHGIQFIRQFTERAMHAIGLVVLLACLMATPVWADLWTNQAGRVIEGRIEAFDGAQVTLTRTNGSSLRLPLSALSEADQHRVRLHTGHSLAPAFVQQAYRDARTILEKFERLPSERRTEEARTGSIRMACAIFDARLKPRLGELKDKDVLEEIARLRASLHGQ